MLVSALRSATLTEFDHHSAVSGVRAPLLAFVLRLTGGALQRAEDVAQKSMVRAWREAGVGSIYPGQSLMPWPAAVARRPAHRRGQAQAPSELRAAVAAITRHVDDYADRMRLPRAA